MTDVTRNNDYAFIFGLVAFSIFNRSFSDFWNVELLYYMQGTLNTKDKDA